MFSVGQKKQKVKSMGNKNYYLNNIGHKTFDRIGKGSQLSATQDGIINNYSNSADSHSEPIKGVEYKANKRNFQVEKPKKQKSDKNNFD